MQVNTVGAEKSKGLNFQVNLNTREYRVSHEKDGSWSASSALALKGDLGEWGGYKIIKTDVTDLNNPPNAFIIQTTPNASIPGFPTGIGGNTVLALQLYPGRDTFSAQLAFGFNMDKIAIRRKYNSTTWTDWKYFTAS